MALPEKLLKNMERFQAKNNLPVFLKGGPLDTVLYRLTLGLCGLGLLGFVNLVYTMGFKRKNE